MNSQVAIITGASRGIGYAVAERFAQRGVKLLLVARKPEPLESVASRLREAGATCETLAGDIALAKTATDAVALATSRFGGVDILVNNAGAAPLRAVAEMSDAEFTGALNVNLAGVFYPTRAVWPVLQSRGGGIIVNISSVAAFDPFPGFSVYGACKTWVNAFTSAVAKEGQSANIRVYAVAPGAVETDLLRSAFPTLPAEQCLQPADVAALVETLCSAPMQYSSGETILIRR